MTTEINQESYEEIAEAIKQTFKKYYPKEPLPKINALSWHFASAMMYEATEHTRKFKPAMILMKTIPSLNAANMTSWLIKLPFTALFEMWQTHNDIYNLAFIGVFKKFQLPYNDLLMEQTPQVTAFLAQYNSILGTSYK